MRESAAAGLMSCAQTREEEIKNSCSLYVYVSIRSNPHGSSLTRYT